MKNYAKPGEVLYHVGLSVEMLQGAKYALVPGDPGRVEGLAKAVDPDAVYLACHREFTSWLARVNGEPVLVISSGMGGPCITFIVEELGRLGVTTFIRVGTTGSLQEDLHLGDVVISKACVRMDGAGRAYAPIEYPAVADLDVTIALRDAAKELKVPFGLGIGVTGRPWAAPILRWKRRRFLPCAVCTGCGQAPSAAWWPNVRTARPWHRRMCTRWRRNDSRLWRSGRWKN